MAHEITETDGRVLAKNAAWHGLGTIVQDAPTPREALGLAKLDWEVELWPMMACEPLGDDVSFDAPIPSDRYGVVRKDTRTCLGVVGDRYEPYQNAQLADFCDALAKEGHAKIESAGSIRGGCRVWFLLQAGSLLLRKEDLTKEYLLCSTSHDGSSRVRIAMTGIRVVCSNILSLALEGLKESVVELQHSGDVKKKLIAAREVFDTFGEARKFSHEKMRHLSETAATADDLRAFWAKAYQRDYGKIPTSPITNIEKRQFEKAMNSWVAVEKRYTRERKFAGDTWWNVMNAYTGHIQHDVQPRGKNAAARYEKYVDQRLFGVVGHRTFQAFKDSLALAG